MKIRQIMIALLITLSLVVVGCTSDGQSTSTGAAAGNNNDPATPSADSVIEVETKSTKTESEEMDETLEQIIADGTYVDEQQYMTPGGEEDIRVTLSVENDVITNVELIGFGELHRNSDRYIKLVAGELPSLLEGKSISEVDNLPTNIAGSSLTVAAFKESVNEIIVNN